MLITGLGFALILMILLDAFEALVLPRRITRFYRPARIYYRIAWGCWRQLALLIPRGKYRENTLSVFGPFSLLLLFAIWANLLVLGFALIYFGMEIPLHPTKSVPLLSCWYMSGVTFFTLGYGDLTPGSVTGKILCVAEAGLGFGFLAIVIGYLPVLYQAFSRREQLIAILDARASSPPTSFELLRRIGGVNEHVILDRLLFDWELWAADLLESQLSYPVLGYYRSQHDNQSWVSTLSLILDTSALLLSMPNSNNRYLAELSFAMARHACVDLCLVFWLPPKHEGAERLTREEWESFAKQNAEVAASANETKQRLDQLRAMYEPFLLSLGEYFAFRLPRFAPEGQVVDNWQTSAWTARTPGIGHLPKSTRGRHF
ncbi:MAG: potassium channel family protein [Planctomycetota bacterium]